MTHFILIRHGETDWNVEGRYQGQLDIPINERGRKQSYELIPLLAVRKPSMIYCSDLSRAWETAEILGSELGISITRDPRLREIHLGSWEGMLFQEIQAKYSELLLLRKLDPHIVSAPGGETLIQVQSRVLAAIDDIKKHHQNESVAIISHGLPLAILQALQQGRRIEEVWDLIPQHCLPIELEL